VDEAVKYNKRNLKYIAAILRRWKEEGIKTGDKKDKGDGSAGLKVEE
jgi:DnaD/phage-associated family protein